tara:strand:+ start:24097 stop:25725 length:1629 start_codon:yes stop_codon:yes gene_type:complete
VNFTTVHLSILLAIFWGVVALAAVGLNWERVSAGPAALLSAITTSGAGAFLALLSVGIMNRSRARPLRRRILAALLVAAPISVVYTVLGLLLSGGLYQPSSALGMTAQLGQALLVHYPLFLAWCAGILLLDAGPVSRLSAASLFGKAKQKSGQEADAISAHVSALATSNPGLSFAFAWRYMASFWALNLVVSIFGDLTYTQDITQLWRNLTVEAGGCLLGIGAHFLVLHPTRQLDLRIRCFIVLGSAMLATCVYISMIWLVWFEVSPWNTGRALVDTTAGWTALAAVAPRWFIMNLPPFIACFAIYLALEAISLMRLRERQMYETSVLARDAQIKMLRFQLNPHFLFNTLNAISSLVLDNRNEEAESMLMRLSGFLRFALEAIPDEKVSLDEELNAQKLYLDIEKARFDSRLEVQVSATPEARSALLPSLILQPILENAIKYSVSNTSEPVEIRISARHQNGELLVEVVDSGTPHPITVKPGTGVGLANIRSRLALLYGDKAGLTAQQDTDGSFVVRLHLPFEAAEPDSDSDSDTDPQTSES